MWIVLLRGYFWLILFIGLSVLKGLGNLSNKVIKCYNKTIIMILNIIVIFGILVFLLIILY